MIEIIIILTVLFFIAVLFYKQANEQFEILQIEASRLSELPTMYSDRSPIVVSNFQTPALGTEDELRKRPNILQMAVSPEFSLKSLLEHPTALKTFHFNPETAKFLAKESGLQVWFEHHVYKELLPSPYTKWLYTFKTSLWPHHRGLFKTTAFQTVIMPTQGTVRVSVMLGSALPYLPNRWYNRSFHSLTPQDTPLLNQIKFIEIKLRRGNLLLLPAHLIVDITSEGGPASWSFIAEINHPISRLA
jgi:hypothetical protein